MKSVLAFAIVVTAATLALAQCPPVIVQQPVEAGGCLGTDISFQVRVVGDGPVRYWWWQEGRFGIRELPDDGHFFGVDSPTLRISAATLMDREAQYWCMITSPCEPVRSSRAGCVPVCVTDYDDGFGQCGFTTIDTLLYYLLLYEQGAPLADVDDGTFGGVPSPDGGVTIDDLLYFLRRFEEGC